MSRIATLAARQLDAYNASDLDAFVACYHPEVRVYDGENLVCEGSEAFRERYRALFEHGTFGAEVPERLQLGAHCVDRELWWRLDAETGERREGEVLVCYVQRDEVIGQVRFLR